MMLANLPVRRLSAALLALAASAALAACDSGQPASGSLAPPPVPSSEVAVTGPMQWSWKNQDLEGWVPGGDPAEVYWPEGGGVGVVAPSTPESPDIVLRSPPLSFPGATYTRIRVDLETIVPGVQPDLSIYYTTSRHGEAFEYRGAPLDGSLPEPGEPRVLIYDMTALASGGTDWVDSTINNIRFDFPQGADSNHILRAFQICTADDPACAIP